MAQDGRGWHGDKKGHREASLKGQVDRVTNTPMQRDEDDDDLPEVWMKKAKKELEKELDVKTKTHSYAFYEDLGAFALESVEGEANNGESEWIVFPDSETAEQAAIANVKQDLEYEPELFTQDWLQNFIKIYDTDRHIIAGEEADNLVNEVFSKDDIIREADIEYDIEELDGRIAELGRQDEHADEELDEGVISEAEWKKIHEELEKDTEKLEKEKEKLIDDAKEKVREDKYEEIYKALEDPVQYFVHDQGVYSMKDLMEASFITINIEEAAEAAVRDDGVGHFLDVYDSSGVELPSGAVAYGTN